MERTRDLGGCEVEGVFELFFSNRQHPFHPRHGAVFLRRLFYMFKNLADELRVLDGRGPHRASKLRTCVPKRLSQGLTRAVYKIGTSDVHEGSSYTLNISRRQEDQNVS